MARARKNRAPAPIDANESPAEGPVDAPPVDSTPSEPESSPPPAQQPAALADPRPLLNISLSAHRGGPRMRLLRSQRFNQMQIRFEGEQPDEKYLAMLAEAGWRDRTETEGVWTKQIDKNGRWQSVDRMEREFKAVGNAIRQDKGLAPALEGLGVA